MLSYSSPRPDFIWVPVEDEFGIEEILKVSFIYLQFPYTCSHCRAFGDSFSRCINNPDAVSPPPRARPNGVPVAKAAKTNHNNTKAPTKQPQIEYPVIEEAPATAPAVGETNVHDHAENFEANRDFNPYVVDEFLGCNVVMDDDKVIEKINNARPEQLEEIVTDYVDDLENLDVGAPNDVIVGNEEIMACDNEIAQVDAGPSGGNLDGRCCYRKHRGEGYGVESVTKQTQASKGKKYRDCGAIYSST